jgi:hypothetical protein
VFFTLSQNVRMSLILDVILNVNLKINSQRMIGSTIALYANHNKIQQSHVEFCCLIKFLKNYEY